MHEPADPAQRADRAATVPAAPAAADGGVQRRGRGFRAAGALLRGPVRKASESRGFAVARVLTHWTEIAGAEAARLCRPVRLSHKRGGLGATLTLLVPGPHAPLVQMQLETIRARVNAVYGYNAVARIALTQTAPHGFAEAQAVFAAAPGSPDGGLQDARTLDPRARSRARPDGARADGARPDAARPDAARTAADGIADAGLRTALETLARNVMTRSDPQKGP